MGTAMRITRANAVIVALALALALGGGPAGCKRVQTMVKKTPSATATILPTKGNEARGQVRFVQGDGIVVVSGRITGLTPGAHGMHVHEKGNCSAPDASSAGPHYNPYKAPHAGPRSEAHHAGDIGNIIADHRGIAEFSIEVRGITVLPPGNSVVGRSVAVDVHADDLVTQPWGNDGQHAACGLISRDP